MQRPAYDYSNMPSALSPAPAPEQQGYRPHLQQHHQKHHQQQHHEQHHQQHYQQLPAMAQNYMHPPPSATFTNHPTTQMGFQVIMAGQEYMEQNVRSPCRLVNLHFCPSFIFYLFFFPPFFPLSLFPSHLADPPLCSVQSLCRHLRLQALLQRLQFIRRQQALHCPLSLAP